MNNEPVPEWFSLPQVVDAIRPAYKSPAEKGLVLFLVGLSRIVLHGECLPWSFLFFAFISKARSSLFFESRSRLGFQGESLLLFSFFLVIGKCVLILIFLFRIMSPGKRRNRKSPNDIISAAVSAPANPNDSSTEKIIWIRMSEENVVSVSAKNLSCQ